MKTTISDFPKKITFKSTGEVLELSEVKEIKQRPLYSSRGKIRPVTVKPVPKNKTYIYTSVPEKKPKEY